MAAQRPRDEPPGQLLEPILDPICRSWPGRLHRVVRQPQESPTHGTTSQVEKTCSSLVSEIGCSCRVRRFSRTAMSAPLVERLEKAIHSPSGDQLGPNSSKAD